MSSGLSSLQYPDRPQIRDRLMGLGSLAFPVPDYLAAAPHYTTSDRN